MTVVKMLLIGNFKFELKKKNKNEISLTQDPYGCENFKTLLLLWVLILFNQTCYTCSL